MTCICALVCCNCSVPVTKQNCISSTWKDTEWFGQFVSLFLRVTSSLPDCQTVSAPKSTRPSRALTGLGKWRVSASATEHGEKDLFCVSESVQKDKLDELLGPSRLFLMLNMHPNTAFWQPNRGARANSRWGGGTKCYRKYGCSRAKHNMNPGIWQMSDDVPWKIRVTPAAAPDVMPRDAGPSAEDARLTY